MSIYRYRAFISYSRSDQTIATKLHARLEQFVLPTALRIAPDGGDSRPLRPIFRDRDELVPGGALATRIQSALEFSEFLVVLCSPAAASSHWVTEEVRRFQALGRADRILPVVIAGEPNALSRGLDPALECLPAPLRETVGPTVTPSDPLWVDWREHGRRRRVQFLSIVACLLSLESLDELVRRDDLRRRRNRWFGYAGGAFLALAIPTLLAAIQSSYARRVLLSASREMAAKGLVIEARSLSIGALPTIGNNDASTLAAEEAGLRVRIVGQYGIVPYEGFKLSSDGSLLVMGDNTPTIGDEGVYWIALWNAQTGELQRRLPQWPGSPQSISNDGTRMISERLDLSDPTLTALWNTRTGEKVTDFGGDDQAYVVELSANGKRAATFPFKLASDTTPQSAILWNAANGQKIGAISSGTTMRFAFSDDGSLLGTGAGEIWDALTGRRIFALGHPIDQVRVSGNGRTVVFVEDAGPVTVYDRASRAGYQLPLGTKVERYFLSSDGELGVFIVADGTAELWRLRKRQRISRLEAGPPVSFGTFGANNSRFVLWTGGTSATIWSAEGRLVGKTENANVRFGYTDGDRALLQSDDYSASLWDLRRGVRIANLGMLGSAEGIDVARNRAFIRSRANQGTLFDTSTILNESGAKLRMQICGADQNRIRPFTNRMRKIDRDLAPHLTGLPWNPCDWKGLDTWEGWHQLGRRLFIWIGAALDYQCPEVNAAGRQTKVSQQQCNLARDRESALDDG